MVALLTLLAVTAIALRIAPRLAWPATGLLFVLLGTLCAEIAPAVNQKKELTLLADNSPRTVEGEVVRAGPVRTVMSTTPFSTKTREERSQQMDLRLDSPADSTVRVTVYAPAEEAFPQIRCGDALRAALTMHREERFLDRKSVV
jgi:competence protein ComEC